MAEIKQDVQQDPDKASVTPTEIKADIALLQRVQKRLESGDQQLTKWLSNYLAALDGSDTDGSCGKTPGTSFCHSSGSLDTFYSRGTPLNRRIEFRRRTTESDSLVCPQEIVVLGYITDRARMSMTFTSRESRDAFVEQHSSETFLWTRDGTNEMCYMETTKLSRAAWKLILRFWQVEVPWNERVASFLESCSE